jgi:hypothetical protein
MAGLRLQRRRRGWWRSFDAVFARIAGRITHVVSRRHPGLPYQRRGKTEGGSPAGLPPLSTDKPLVFEDFVVR